MFSKTKNEPVPVKFLKRWSVRVLVFGLAIIGMVVRAGAAETGWKAGTARAVITPQKPIWMAGYGSRTAPADGKIHELNIRVLALEDAAGQRGIVLSSDLLGFPKPMYDAICLSLLEKTGLKQSQIMLHSSHTHCGPVLKAALHDIYPVNDEQVRDINEYSDWLTSEVVTTVEKALADLKPATVWRGSGSADFAVNRRTNREPDVPKLREENLLFGPVDHTVPVLAVKDANGKLKAVVFTYACHNTTLSVQQWCGDYAGFAQYQLEAEHPGAMALFCMGCGADQNPLPRRTVELCEQYGKSLAAAVEAVLNQPLLAVKSKLEMRHKFVWLAMDPLPPMTQLEQMAAQPVSYSQRWASRMLKEVRSGVAQPREYAYPIQAWRLGGDQLWITLGGEVVVDYVLRLKSEISDQIWVSAYTNDVMAYIPSRRVLLEGGYEGQSSMMVYGLPTERWSPDVEERVVNGVMGLVRDWAK